jgi:hypothetical protein
MFEGRRALRRGGVGVFSMLAIVILMSLNPASVSAVTSAQDLAPFTQARQEAVYPVKVSLVPNPRTDLTFARDVAPIIQQNCEKCHQPGNVSPMVLQTYEQVRLYAPLIRDRVIKRQMPPWPIDRTVGITEFKNDPSLSDEEIRTIVDWVDSGTPLGDAADMPEPMVWADALTWEFEEQLGPPDMVLQSPMYNVVANGMDQWPTPITPLDEVQIDGAPLMQDRWVKAVAVRPHNYEARYVFHHANPGLIMPGEVVDPNEPESGRVKFIDSAVGTQGRIFPENQGRLIRPGSSVTWGMHFFPYSHDIEAALQVAVWYYPEGYEPEFYSMGDVQMQTSMTSYTGEFNPRNGAHDSSGRLHAHSDILIPPHSVVTLKGIHRLDRPAMLHSVRGHMHLLGKYEVVEAIYPDGRWEIISKLNWDHSWHTLFLYEDHVAPLLPEGTILILSSTFDNTVNNPHNEDPDQWITGGDRSVDEMGHIRLGLTYFETEEDFQKMVDERRDLLTTMPAAEQP